MSMDHVADISNGINHIVPSNKVRLLSQHLQSLFLVKFKHLFLPGSLTIDATAYKLLHLGVDAGVSRQHGLGPEDKVMSFAPSEGKVVLLIQHLLQSIVGEDVDAGGYWGRSVKVVAINPLELCENLAVF